jgi:radical SAM superfamily enzyme YgiQ (UPF0313 family)
MAHITFIRPPFVVPADMVGQQQGTPPLGMAYLLGSLKEHGHDVCAIDGFGEDVNRCTRLGNLDSKGIYVNGILADDIVARIPVGTDVVAVTCMFSNEWLYTRHIINKVRACFPDVPIIAGGEHITAESYRSMLYTPALTACALGEGEELILELIDAIMCRSPLTDVHGIAFFDDDGNYRKTERKNRLRGLDEIPLPSWEEIPLENYLRAQLGNGTLGRRSIPMLASRGCPYTCTFCSSPSMWGTRWISRDPKLVVDEIESYVDRYNIDHIDFADLTTVINRRWIIDFCKLLIARQLPVTWSLSSGTRSEALDQEVLGYMKSAGIERITYAPESGSEKTLQRVKKRVNLQKMTESIRACVKVGICSRANFIFGLPGQTKLECFESIAFATKLCLLGMHDVACMCFAPYPGSYLFEKLVAEEKIKIDETFDEFLITNLTTKVFGMKSWSEHIPSWSMPLWIIGTTMYFYALQFVTRPVRLFRLLHRMAKKKPVTMIETILYGQWIRLFTRQAKMDVRNAEFIDRNEMAEHNVARRQKTADRLVVINSGNPERGLF